MGWRIDVPVLTVLAVTALVGCSSGPSGEPAQSGALSAGTAEITVNDNDLGQFQAVSCTRAGDLTKITTGNDESGSTAYISNADGLTAKTVVIHDLGGFTGSFWEDLQGDAEVTLTGNTYSITGEAQGFLTEKPSFRAPGTFHIEVAC